MLSSLQQTKEAVRLTEEAHRTAKSSTTADNRSRGEFASGVTMMNRFAPAGKP